MLEAADAWCWDARPWPAFPGRDDIWADASGWRCGHWLNGRLHGETRDLIHALLERGGLDTFEIGAVTGRMDGYVVDRPTRVRDALEPLLAGLGMRTVERGGRIAVIGDEPVTATLQVEAFALPDEGSAISVERSLEPRPAIARVRFIDGARDYQIGSVLARTAGDGGDVDLDLPAVCGPALAQAAAERALIDGEGGRLKVALGPVEALRLEPGDVVAIDGWSGLWRVSGLDIAEAASATLEPVRSVLPGEDMTVPDRPDDGAVVGAPFFRMLDLPPLPGAEDAAGPFAVVAAEPWRPMQVRAGASTDALTLRADIDRPATVGVLTAPLSSGLRYRWDETSVLMVRVEGRAPESRSEAAVLAGANAVAIETTAGWELLQFRRADLLGDDVWRLSGLLRGQQGTEAAMRAGAGAGAIAALLDAVPPKVLSPRSERGLPLIWRAGPTGLPGGRGVSELHWTPTGAHDRPWSPAHLRCRARSDDGYDLSWAPRARLDGDRWDGEVAASDPSRFRVQVILEGAPVRTVEVEAAAFVYAGPDVVADFPAGPPEGVTISVAQWGEGYGWGETATTTL